MADRRARCHNAEGLHRKLASNADGRLTADRVPPLAAFSALRFDRLLTACERVPGLSPRAGAGGISCYRLVNDRRVAISGLDSVDIVPDRFQY
jgi:hypothetical protein